MNRSRIFSNAWNAYKAQSIRTRAQFAACLKAAYAAAKAPKTLTIEEYAKQINGSVWMQHGKTRIYFNGFGKDIKAYFDFTEGWLGLDENGIAKGAKLQVFTDAKNVSYKWIENRKAEVFSRIRENVLQFVNA